MTQEGDAVRIGLFIPFMLYDALFLKSGRVGESFNIPHSEKMPAGSVA